MRSRTYLRILNATALLAASLACSFGAMADTNAPPGPKIRIACVGDSVTAAGYPDVMALLYQQDKPDKYQVTNSGVYGATAMKSGDLPYWNQKKIDEIAAYAPQIVTIMLGANDSKPANWKNKETFLGDYKELITTLKNLPSKPKVYVLLPTPVFDTNPESFDGGVLSKEIMPLINRAAAETKTEVIDVYNPFTNSAYLFPDNARPNGDGSDKVARCIYRSLTGAPLLEPMGDIFVSSMMVKILRSNKDPVYYTLDGKWPGTNSFAYKNMPLKLTNTTRVTALSIGKNGSSPAVTAMFIKVPVYGASKPGKVETGLDCNYYENKDAAALDDMDKLSPVSSCVTNSLEITGMDPKKEFWGYKWTGYITAPRDGIYKFMLTSDDGSTLRIDNTLVVDNSGGHPTRERSGKAALKAGPHSIAVTFYNLVGSWSFKAEWEPPGMTRQLIPPSALSHEVAGL